MASVRSERSLAPCAEGVPRERSDWTLDSSLHRPRHARPSSPRYAARLCVHHEPVVHVRLSVPRGPADCLLHCFACCGGSRALRSLCERLRLRGMAFIFVVCLRVALMAALRFALLSGSRRRRRRRLFNGSEQPRGSQRPPLHQPAPTRVLNLHTRYSICQRLHPRL